MFISRILNSWRGSLPLVTNRRHTVICICFDRFLTILCFQAELEAVLGMIGEVAARFKDRLDILFSIRTDQNGRRFNGAINRCHQPPPSTVAINSQDVINWPSWKNWKDWVEDLVVTLRGEICGISCCCCHSSCLICCTTRLQSTMLLITLCLSVHQTNSLHGSWYCWSGIAITGIFLRGQVAAWLRRQNLNLY